MFRCVKLRRYAAKWVRTWRAIDEHRGHRELARNSSRTDAVIVESPTLQQVVPARVHTADVTRHVLGGTLGT